MTGINARHESSFAYDAAWAIALVLNASAQRLAGRFRKELVYRLVDSFGRVGKSADLVSRAIFSTNGRQKLSMFLKKNKSTTIFNGLYSYVQNFSSHFYSQLTVRLL